MSRKHYGIFAANYLPNLGGVERYTYNLAKELLARGNRVTIVTSNVFSLPSKEVQDGITIYRMPCWNLLDGRFPVLKYGKLFRRMDKALRRLRFDFILVQTRFYIHSLYAVSFAKKTRTPCIVMEHGTNHFTVNHPIFDFCGHIYEHLISALVKSRCKHFYGVSQDCCNWLRHFGIVSDGILYNAVDLKDIREKSAHPVENYRERFSPQNKTIVAYAGRLVKEKGIQKLVAAARKLQKSGLDIALLIAGDGALYEHIRQANLPQVYLLGRLDFEHVVSLLQSSDIFCLPTDYPEGFPTSVLEAAACGCYVITTTNGGSKELILNREYGAVLSKNSVENIMEAIRYAAQNTQYTQKAVQNTYARLEKRFTWENTASRLIEIAEKM